MDLDNHEEFSRIDPEDMYSHIENLPRQIETAWRDGHTLPLPSWEGIKGVVVTGMGGSAIGADLAVTFAAAKASIPVAVVREYDLPGWVRGSGVLVIGSSHSGNTEETLSAFQQARERGCRLMSISTGGKLFQKAQEFGAPAWTFDHRGQPRAAVGFSFGLMISILSRLSVIPDPALEVQKTVSAMRQQQEALRREIPVRSNPAKRIAGQLLDRWVTVLASDYLVPVARRWKGQFSEVAKAWAQFEALPEADHNTLAGTLNPQSQLEKMAVLFLKSPSDHPRNQKRIDLTRRAMMTEGLATDVIEAPGDCPMAHMWTALHYGDYAAYYLAMLYQVDPTPISIMIELKQALSQI